MSNKSRNRNQSQGAPQERVIGASPTNSATFDSPQALAMQVEAAPPEMVDELLRQKAEREEALASRLQAELAARSEAAEFSDAAKVVEVDNGPEWQNVAYTLLNEFRAHGGIFEFLRTKSTGLTDPNTGLSVLGKLTHSDRTRIVELLMPFVADSRVARFCGVGPKAN